MEGLKYMSNICTVEIDNDSYYIECDRVSDLQFIDGYLVNYSNSSLTLRTGFDPDNTVYPYISCSSMSVCDIRTSSNWQSQPVTSNFTYSGDLILISDHVYLILIVLFLILGVRLLWKH